MSKETILEISIDAELKAQAETLYQRFGLSFAEAVRLFAQQSVDSQTVPLVMPPKRKLGIVQGKYVIPDNIDDNNGEIAKMFGVS